MSIELSLARHVVPAQAASALAQSVKIDMHQLLADVSVAEGGNDAGPSPHDFYDTALASCKALTVMWYARKAGIPVDDIHTVVTRDSSKERDGIYRLSAKLQIKGELTDAQMQKLQAVAEKCPVHKLMTAVTTEIETQVERLA
ncbi:OsmC family protein [Variovorax sp. HJSM1_2]|uniref:OsmC family protein n=1 Tax=Variovorax sp. HJSM1_2 TaxID=3366263 RepID=UPI003BBED62E